MRKLLDCICLLQAIVFLLFSSSCSSQQKALTYSRISIGYVKQTAVGEFSQYSMALGKSTFVFTIDTIYGNSKDAWLIGRILLEERPIRNFCAYSIKFENMKYYVSKVLGCSDESGLISIKAEINENTIRFLITNNVRSDTLSSQLIELYDISPEETVVK